MSGWFDFKARAVPSNDAASKTRQPLQATWRQMDLSAASDPDSLRTTVVQMDDH